MSTLTTAQRAALPATDFGDPQGRKYPIVDQNDVDSAASLIGKAADAAAVKARIIAIAKRKGLQLPDAWQPKAAGEPTSSDVHVDTAMKRPSASRYLARLRDLAKGHFTKMATMTAGQFDELMRQARGHAGGKARADSRQAYDPYMDMPTMTPPPLMDDAEMPDPFLYPKADARVNYRQATQIGQQCSACVHFLEDCGACALVEGRIAPDGLCDLFVDDALEDASEPDDGDQMAEPREVAALCATHADAPDGWRLFLEAPDAFAEAPDWMPVLPKPGRYQHPSYGEMVITPERNARFVHQFQARVYQDRLPVDAEHQTKLSGAMGWITALRQNADGSADARVDWTDRGRSLIAADRFRYVSPEWYERWTAPDTGVTFDDVLIGAAITTRPFFKESALRPLVASERGLEMLDGPPPADAAPVLIFHALAPVVADTGTTPQGGKMAEPQVVALTEDQARAMTERITALEAERDAARAMAEQASTAATQAAERVGALEGDARRKRFTDEVMGRSDSNGQRWYGEPDKHVTLLERMAQAFGEDSDEVRQYVEQNRAQAAQLRELVGSEVGRPGHDAATSAWVQIQAKAASLRASEPGLTQAQAIARVATEDAKLYAAYTAEQAGR